MISHRQPQRIITWRSLLFFLGSLLALTWLLVWSEATHKLDRLMLDTWVRANHRPPPEDVVIVGIDPASLAQIGRWPWPRQVQAQMLDALADAGVQAAVVDLLYVEPDDSRANDRAIAAALQRIPLTILPVLTEGQQGPSTAEKLPVPDILRAATHLGHIMLPIDDDGLVRRVALKSGFREAHWSTLSLAALENIDPLAPVLQDLPGVRQEGPRRALDWLLDYEVLIPFYGGQGTFDSVSASDLLQGDLPPGILRGKIVFVGLTAMGLEDIVPSAVSPLGQPLPGVEVHATVFSALRDGSLVTAVNPLINLYCALFLLPLMLAVYSRARPVWALAAAVGLALVPVLASFVAFWEYRLWYAPLASSVPVLLSYVLWSWHRLDFVNRFLEDELRQVAPNIAEPHRDHAAELQRFFANASRHLPIDGWSFSWRGTVHSAGCAVKAAALAGSTGQWSRDEQLHTRRFSQEYAFVVAFRCQDAVTGHEIERYIDSLARVKIKPPPSRSPDSIERLQNSAQKLSDQVKWLRGVKVFSETMLAGSPAGFMVWNPAGELVRGNDITYQLLPQLPESPLLIDFLKVVGHELDDEDDAQHLRALVSQGEPWQLTYHQGEHECVVNLSAVGEVLAERLICASVVDVSDIRTVERARAEMVDYLSHDLRSPLISALYQLEQQTQNSQLDTEALARAERNILRSLAMMDDLLNVARADNLRSEQFDEVLFDAVLDNALDQLAPQARARDIALQVESAEELWLVGDAVSLERTVVNVIGNAVKYSPDGSAVEVHLTREGQWMRLTVSDQGVGIEPSFLDELFTRFRRSSDVAGQFKGIGLGLALVARVVHLHGGQVGASNGASGGAVIEIRLPLVMLDTGEPDDGSMPGALPAPESAPVARPSAGVAQTIEFASQR